MKVTIEKDRHGKTWFKLEDQKGVVGFISREFANRFLKATKEKKK
jgi:hypothetical protein